MAQLQQFEGNVENFNPNSPYSGDARLHVEFYHGYQQNDAKSLEAGRPIYDDVECIKIYNSKDNIIDRPVRDTDMRRWPQKYQAWKMGDAASGESGTLLMHWPVITRAIAEELKYFKIFTVEQLAGYPDSSQVPVLGFTKLKQMAQQTLDMAAGNAPLLKMQAELDAKSAELAAANDQLIKMNTRLEALEAKRK